MAKVFVLPKRKPSTKNLFKNPGSILVFPKHASNDNTPPEPPPMAA